MAIFLVSVWTEEMSSVDQIGRFSWVIVDDVDLVEKVM